MVSTAAPIAPSPAVKSPAQAMPPAEALPLPRLAAVDIGTNSMRLVVAEVQPDGSYRVLDEDRDMTRLGQGLYGAGRIADGPMERSLQALGKMKAIADGFSVTELRAVATSAVREASNGRDFVREAWRRYRVHVEVVRPEEEARLAFQSASRHYDLDEGLTAIVDIGGGSAEVILAAGGVVEQIVSLPLGAVRLTERHSESDPLRPKHWKALRREIDQVITEGLGKPPFAAALMIGSGGTFTNLAEMVQAERSSDLTHARDYAVSRAEVRQLLDRLRETPLAARRQIPGLNPQRADIIVAGVAVVARLAKRLGTQSIVVNDRGVRDGVLLSMIDDLSGAGPAAGPDGVGAPICAQVSLERAALRARRHPRARDLRRAARRLRPAARRARHPAGGGSAARRRLSDQPRAKPHARVPPHHPW